MHSKKETQTIRYFVEHVTTYTYSAPVAISHHAAYLSPTNSPQQTIERFRLDISPRPRDISEHLDYFNNVRHQFSIIENHSELTVTMLAQVQKLIRELPTADLSPTCKEVFRFLKAPITRDAVQASEFMFATPLTSANSEIADYAKRFFTPNKSYLQCLIDLNQEIHDTFVFDSEATDVNTPLAQFFKQKRGVCQDFAHFMIACLRSQGFSAGYTSGYLLTHPPESQARMEGTDASHAWVSVHVPEIGWVDFDPTNAILVNHEHIQVARGRDYQDVAPIKGAVSGGGEQTIDIEVTVRPEWELEELLSEKAVSEI